MWNPGTAVDDDQLHFMVRVMETWFLADREALRAYYGSGIESQRRPNTADIEAISKDQLDRSLKDATRPTSKGEYHKTKHAPSLLGSIHYDVVRKHAKSPERFVTSITRVLDRSTGA